MENDLQDASNVCFFSLISDTLRLSLIFSFCSFGTTIETWLGNRGFHRLVYLTPGYSSDLTVLTSTSRLLYELSQYRVSFFFGDDPFIILGFFILHL